MTNTPTELNAAMEYLRTLGHRKGGVESATNTAIRIVLEGCNFWRDLAASLECEINRRDQKNDFQP